MENDKPRCEWQGIESAPKDGTPFLAAIWVRVNDRPRAWEIYIVGYDAEYGEWNNDYETGWDLEDYAFWMPLPDAPTPPNAGE